MFYVSNDTITTETFEFFTLQTVPFTKPLYN